MQQDELGALVGKTAALMEQFERRCVEIDRRQQALAHELQALTQRLPVVVAQSADGSLRSLHAGILEHVHGGLRQPVEAYEQRLRAAGGLLDEGARRLASQLHGMQRLHRRLVWTLAGVTACGLLLLVAAGAWIAQR